MNIFIGAVLLMVIAVGVVFMINGVGLFAPSKRPRLQDDPDVINGLVARVTRAIGTATNGVVVYSLDGAHREVPAKSVDGTSIQAGADVVIERIEEGTAFVERWEVVEGRI